MEIKKAGKSGLCYGVKRAVAILEKVCHERGMVETLGVEVHNRQLQQRLAEVGVRVARDLDDIRGDTVVISAHGVSPQLEEEIRRRNYKVVDTTCPIVHRAQIAAHDLAKSGFLVVIYGDAEHPEVKGILGWADDKGVATTNSGFIAEMNPLPSHLGIVSQTTQITANYNKFIQELAETHLPQDSELRTVDTICHYIKERQASAIELAKNVDLMVVIGGYNSANTNRLVELCSTVTETYQVEMTDEIQSSWLSGKHSIGVAGGASTTDQTIDELVAKLKTMV
ncbi:4-hydroxy-3-methylbut-2-enyl diphosphate reductase [Chloroflexota bacterium]